jgi:hypothetical protein
MKIFLEPALLVFWPCWSTYFFSRRFQKNFYHRKKLSSHIGDPPYSRKNILRDNVGCLRRGGLAQLVERVLSMHEVVSSILTFSTFVSFLHLRLLAHRVVAWWPFTRQANIACIVLFYMYCISSVVAAC